MMYVEGNRPYVLKKGDQITVLLQTTWHWLTSRIEYGDHGIETFMKSVKAGSAPVRECRLETHNRTSSWLSARLTMRSATD